MTARTRRAPLVAVLAAVSALALGACTSSSDIESAAATAGRRRRRAGRRHQPRPGPGAHPAGPGGHRPAAAGPRGRRRAAGRDHPVQRTAGLLRRRQHHPDRQRDRHRPAGRRRAGPRRWSWCPPPGPNWPLATAVRRRRRHHLQRHGHRGAQAAVRLLLLPGRQPGLPGRRRLRPGRSASPRTSPASPSPSARAPTRRRSCSPGTSRTRPPGSTPVDVAVLPERLRRHPRPCSPAGSTCTSARTPPPRTRRRPRPTTSRSSARSTAAGRTPRRSPSPPPRATGSRRPSPPR